MAERKDTIGVSPYERRAHARGRRNRDLSLTGISRGPRFRTAVPPTADMALFTTCVLLAVGRLPTVLVTGAAGRTGSLLYQSLKQDSRIGEVRALVRNVTKAKLVLNCSKCDESEGIYVGDVTKPDTMSAAMTGVDTLAIAAAVGGAVSAKVMREVEFDGVENQVSVLAQQHRANHANANTSALRVILCSSMGTTNPNPPPFEGGKVLFWKLNAEAFLMSSGIGATVVKPCGLSDGPAGHKALDVLHDECVTADQTQNNSYVSSARASTMLTGPELDLSRLAVATRRPSPLPSPVPMSPL